MAPINDRMPVIVAPKNYERWLDTDSKSTPSRDLLQPYPAEEMEVWTLSSYVESGIELPYMSAPPISAFSATAPHCYFAAPEHKKTGKRRAGRMTGCAMGLRMRRSKCFPESRKRGFCLIPAEKHPSEPGTPRGSWVPVAPWRKTPIFLNEMMASDRHRSATTNSIYHYRLQRR
jgi:hypothetical protein